MSAELGSTQDPKALVPGHPDGVHATSVSMTAYGDALHEAGDGLKRIDSTEGWDGPAAENFRSAFDGEPAKWLDAGDCFHHAAAALDQYCNTLTWAQGQAAEAIRLFNEAEAASSAARAEHARASEHAQQQAPAGAAAAEVPLQDPGQAKREAAQATLDRARNQLATAGETAADTVARARDKAPENQSWLGDALDAAGNAAGTLINGAASLGNAALNHPTMAAGMVGGAALTSLSAAGETAGVVLDATGVGAVGGVPLNAVSAAGVATGVGMMGASMAGLASEASGDDETEVVDTSDAEPAPAPDLPWEDPEVQEKIPDEWGDGDANKKGVGQRWTSPDDPKGTGIRIDQGNPNNSQPTQQVDHVIVRENGKVLGRDGEPIQGSIKHNPEQAHIPLKEWKQWQSWNTP